MRLLSLCSLVAAASLFAQSIVDTKNWTAAEDHQNMMDQLGIKALRPGPSGNESAPNHANYDDSLANPFPDLPDVLKLKNGKKVTSAKMWRGEGPARSQGSSHPQRPRRRAAHASDD